MIKKPRTIEKCVAKENNKKKLCKQQNSHGSSEERKKTHTFLKWKTVTVKQKATSRKCVCLLVTARRKKARRTKHSRPQAWN